MDQYTKDLEYLRHVVLNTCVNMMGCMREMEKLLNTSTRAVKEFNKTWEEEPPGSALDLLTSVNRQGLTPPPKKEDHGAGGIPISDSHHANAPDGDPHHPDAGDPAHQQGPPDPGKTGREGKTSHESGVWSRESKD